MDVLDGGNLLLANHRARTLHHKTARWLQRDPTGYADGPSLYESFRNNAMRFTDPMGTDTIISEGGDLTYQSYPVWGMFGPEDPFVWRFALGYGPDHVLIDHPRWPYAFVMQRSLAESEFNPGPWVSLRSVDEIMMKATSMAMQEGGRFREGQLNEEPAIQVLDKSSSNPQWALALEFYSGLLGSSDSAFAAQQIDAQVRLWQARGLGNVVATAYTATTGLLAAPAGIAADLVGVADAGIAAVADDASAMTAPALILAATGPFLYVRFGDDVTGALPRGTSAARRGFNRNQVLDGFQEHHIIPNTNPLTKDHELLSLAGFDLRSRKNKIFLPTEGSLHPTRTIHLGRHRMAVSRDIARRMDEIVRIGKQQDWTQQRYHQALSVLLSQERKILKSGRRALNKNARPWAR